MKLLKTFDKKNYNENGNVFSRTAIRGIIKINDKYALVSSRMYGYTKFPGGGQEKDENDIQTLIREVREEIGLNIIESSIIPYGYIVQKQLDTNGCDIFMHTSRYYICSVSDVISPQKLDDYEADEGFHLSMLTLDEAINLNKKSLLLYPEDHTVRDTYVMELLLEKENEHSDIR